MQNRLKEYEATEMCMNVNEGLGKRKYCTSRRSAPTPESESHTAKAKRKNLYAEFINISKAGVA